ncbi:Polysaccharide pyruvyl transferase [Caprobacter fermentans]|uniref:Polysaccharide pyruvyl transferase n=1 Tax=Caproicibacter fermentans TaxID=2576756 RepID=A0A6N8HX36_9FIRM|nr:Polysaccharide pyruvyl transferase [Caproicibacter fermentans]
MIYFFRKILGVIFLYDRFMEGFSELDEQIGRVESRLKDLEEDMVGNNADKERFVQLTEDQLDRAAKQTIQIDAIKKQLLDLEVKVEENKSSNDEILKSYPVMPQDLSNYKEDIRSIVWGDAFVVEHAYARYFNFGDHALGLGVRRAFTKYFFEKCRFEIMDIHRTAMTRYEIDALNHRADLLLVGGGGLIHSADNKHWLFNLDNGLIDYLKCPTVFYALGYNQYYGQDSLTGKNDIELNLAALKAKALSFSVRNDTSKEKLAAMGFDFPEVPDPGFFVGCDHPAPDIKGKYVILQLAYDTPKWRGIETETFINNFKKIIQYLIGLDYTVVLAPHTFLDIKITKLVLEAVGNSRVASWDLHEMIKDENTSRGLGYYQHADFVIAMRGHAQICPIGMGVPVISVATHYKNFGLMDKLGMPDSVLTPNDENFVEKMIFLIDSTIKNNAQLRDNLGILTAEMDQKTRKFLKELRGKYESLGMKKFIN